MGCHPAAPASPGPPKHPEAKQEPLPIRMLLLALVWMLCPGRIWPNPSLIKKYICIPELQTVPDACGKLPARFSFFSLLRPHRDANAELNTPPDLSPALCSPFPKFAASFPGHFHENRRFVSWDSALPVLPVLPSACACLCPPQTQNKRGRDGGNGMEPPNGLVWAPNCP